jgi:phage shock protein A
MVFKKLFPKKSTGKDKATVEAKLKSVIHRLDLKIKDYDNKAKLCRVKAKKFLKTGNKDAARAMLVRFKLYQQKSMQYNSMIAKAERHLEALEEAGVVSDVAGAMEKSAGELKKVAATVNPEKAMNITEEAEDSIDQISEAGELLAGNLEEDAGVDIEDEFAQLETESMLEDAGKLPETPEEGEEESPTVSEAETSVKSKEAIKDEINKLKKELDL